MKKAYVFSWVITICILVISIAGCGLFTQSGEAPRVLSVLASSSTTIEVGFDQTLDSGSAQNTSNYSIQTFDETASVAISAANLGLSQTSVLLTTGSLASSQNYKISISGIKNSSGKEMTAKNYVVLTDIATLDTSVGNSSTAHTSSLGIDSLNKAHIAYYNANAGQQAPMYATNASGSWITSLIASPPTGLGAYGISLALNSSNEACVSYGGTALSLRYAVNVSDTWQTTRFSTATVARWSAIGVDHNNKAHIFYGTGYGVRHITNASGSWEISDILTAESYRNSVAIDTNNSLYISYHDADDKTLKYATDASGSWVDTAIASIENVVNGSIITIGIGNSIGLDSSKKAHIAFDDVANKALKYATNSSGSWVVSTLINPNMYNEGSMPSLIIDSNNKIYIAYFDSSSVEGLKLMTNASGTWKSLYLDPDATSANGFYLGLGSNSKKGLSYYNGIGSATRLKYLSF